MDWECLTDVVSTEFLKFAIASPASSSADLHGQPTGCEVRDRAYALADAALCTAAAQRGQSVSAVVRYIKAVLACASI